MVQRHQKRKRISSAYIMHRMQVMAVKTERKPRERENRVHREAVRPPVLR